jgi:uncharacterized protein YqcC (DUF446 family)
LFVSRWRRDDGLMTLTEARLAELLVDLKTELIRLDLWEPAPPSPAALASPLPFCADTLRFTQWLQWVFIPRTQAVLEGAAPLPVRSGIRPMAEEALAGCGWDTGPLLGLLGAIDITINLAPPPEA